MEWQFSKEFYEKLKSSDDYNFMVKFIFEKAELTFHYVSFVINMLEDYGLHIHTVPLYVFLRFAATSII